MSSNMQFATPPPPINLPNMSVPPPTAPNLSAPPPNLTTINTSSSPSSSSNTNFQARFPPNNRDGNNRGFFKPFRPYHAPKSMSNSQDALQDEFDGKRLRKSVMRKTVDYNSAIIKTLENRVWQRDFRDRRALQPDVMYYPDLLPPPSYVDNPINAVTTRFVKTATNKMRCPIFCMAWTPEGRRLVTGASSGEFTLWNGLTFNFETILQAHDSPVRTMVWSHNESWMVTGDHAGYVKYWQSNMNNVKMFQAHKEAIRGLSFSPTDHKLATCSDDGTVRIWDFLRCHEERILRGHGADVKCVHWHPQKSLVVSGSKDNQQPVKLWDPKTGQSLATLHAHKSTVMDVKWNENGNWLITASRDHLLKLFDIRNLSQEVQTFRGHKKEASSVAWHPSHEGLFCSGGSDGAILFWHVGADKEVGAIEQAHDSIVWTLAWHPLGHILCSGSNDHTSKFWTRNRPGDLMRDKYNLNTLPAGMAGIDDHEIADEAAEIPGMGPEDRIMLDAELEEEASMMTAPPPEDKSGGIPGLDLDHAIEESKKLASKKVPYSKPIPRNFQAQWNEMESEDPEQVEALSAIVNQLIETTPGAVPLTEVAPNAIILYGKMITVEPGSKLADAILKGNDAIQKMIADGEIEELKDVQPIIPEEIIEPEEYLQDEGDIDYSRVPDIDLPAPLPSSKFAQNPELLKSLNLGGKRKFEQLIGWSEASNSSKTHGDDSANSDTDLRYLSNTTTAQDISSYLSQDEDLRRLNAMDRINRDEDLRFGSGSGSSGPGRPDFDLRNAFGDRDFRHTMPPPPFNKSSSSSIDSDKNKYGDQDNRPRVWDDDKIIGNNDLSRNNFDKRNVMPPNMMNNNLQIGQMSNMPSGLGKNHHNMQNISPNMPPSMVPHPNINQIPTNMQNKNNNSNMMGGNGGMNDGQGMNDGPMSGPPHMMHMPPNFGPNGPQMPPNSNFNPNFRPPNGNFGPNQHFRPMGPPFGPPGPFNNFPPNFRCPNPNNPPPNFERPGFGQNYRNQMPGNSSGGGGGNNSGGSFNSGFNKNYDRGGGGGSSSGGGGGNGNNKNGHNSNSNNSNNNRGMNRNSNDNNRNNNYNSSNNNNNNSSSSNSSNNNSNRGRGRDNDQSRGSRSRDNY